MTTAPVISDFAGLNSNGTSVQIARTVSSPELGDWRLLFVHTLPSVTVTPPGPDWTLLEDTAGTITRARLWAKEFTDDPVTDDGLVSFSVNQYWAVQIVRVRGVNPAAFAGPAGRYDGSPSTTITVPSLTPPEVDCARVDFYSFYTSATATAAQPTLPASQTHGGLWRGTASTGYVTRIGHEALSTALATGTRASTVINSYNAGIGVIVRPTPDAPLTAASFLPFFH